MRARQPDAAGRVDARRCRRALGALRRRRADDPAAADVVDHPVAALEAAGALPRPPAPRGHVRRPWQRPVRSAGRAPRPTPTTSSPPTRSPCSTPRPPSGPCSSRLSCGTLWGVQLAADHPDRVLGLVAIGPAVPLDAGPPRAQRLPVRRAARRDRGLGEVQRPLLAARLPRTSSSSSSAGCSPSRTRRSRSRTASGGGWRSTPATLIDTRPGARRRAAARASASVCERVRCPVLVIHGDEDAIRPHAAGAALAEVTGGSLVTIAGGGHGPHARDPVVVNR